MSEDDLKIVIRHLPPTMSEAAFLKSIAPLPPYDYFYYVPGSPNKVNSFSRAYIRFLNSVELRNFARNYDNFVFLDVKGHEYTAQVEFAPFGGVTLASKTGGGRQDHLQGTIENQPEYLNFLQHLKDCASVKNKICPVLHPRLEEKNQDKTTPLVDFVKMKKLSNKTEDKKSRKSKHQRRFKKEEFSTNEENEKEAAEESKSASSFFASNSGRKYKNKKRRQQEVGSKVDSADENVDSRSISHTGNGSETVTRAEIPTVCIRQALGYPPEKTQSIKSHRGDVKVIDKALSTHNLLPNAFKKK